MARYSLGQPVRLSTTVTSIAGVLGNAGALTLVITRPDGTKVTYNSPVNDGPGLYHQDAPTTDLGQAGHYQYLWTSTGTNAGESFGDFDVFNAATDVAILPLQDAKQMLNIPSSDTTNDAELQSWIATIESSMESMTGGPIINRSVTERVEISAGYTVLVVRQRPLVSLVSVVSASSGQPLTITDMTDLDPNAGTIRRALGLPFYGPYFTWLPIFLVTYIAGWGTAVPPSMNSAARIILAHLWQTQRGAVSPPLMGGEETVTLPGFGFAIPNRAAELLENGSQNGIPFCTEAWV